MGVVKALLRWFSYLFHGLLSLFLIGVSGLALATGVPSINLKMLPWSGPTLVYVLLGGGLFGLLSVLLAMLKKFRLLFFLWSLAVTVVLIRGYLLGGYRFAPGEARTAAYLIAASLLALLGAWLQMWRKLRRR